MIWCVTLEDRGAELDWVISHSLNGSRRKPTRRAAAGLAEMPAAGWGDWRELVSRWTWSLTKVEEARPSPCRSAHQASLARFPSYPIPNCHTLLQATTCKPCSCCRHFDTFQTTNHKSTFVLSPSFTLRRHHQCPAFFGPHHWPSSFSDLLPAAV